MPPRRSHKKSRAGCRRCKNRKIKCDEVHPRCGNCEKHGVKCDFEAPELLDDLTPTVSTPATTMSPTATATTPGGLSSSYTQARRRSSPGGPSLSPGGHSHHSHHSQHSHHSHHSSRPSITPQLTPATLANGSSNSNSNGIARAPSNRLMELRLMHHYTSVTSKTFLGDPRLSENIWSRSAPLLAFESESRAFLADAIMAVAALHLRSLHPDDKALVRASHEYAASTLTEYCAALERGINADNAEALFLTATLIAFQAVASRIFAKDDADTDSDDPNLRYSLPLSWFHAFQGVKTVVASSWPYIRNSDVVTTVIDAQPSLNLDLDPHRPNSFFGHLLEDMNDELVNEDPRFAQSTNQSYTHAVSVLNWAHTNMFPVATLMFPATVARRFIELVEAKRPRALAILACFFALLKRLDGVWWLHDVSRREVMGLVSLFESGSKWWRHLEWPIRIALWDGTNIPPDVWGADWTMDTQSTNSFVNHIDLVAELMGQTGTFARSAFAGEPLTAESPD